MMSIYTKEEQNNFAIWLKDAEPCERAVFMYLHRQEYDVEFTATHEIVDNYIDPGDIRININGILGRVEAKHNQAYDYRSLNGYRPYNTNRIFIDSYRHAFIKPYDLPLCAYALVNQSLTGMFWIPYFYKPRWYLVEHIWNSMTKRYEDKAAMSREYLSGLYFDFEKDRLPDSLVHINEAVL